MINKCENLLGRDYESILDIYCDGDYVIDNDNDLARKDLWIQCISELNYRFGVKITSNTETYGKKYTYLLDGYCDQWYKDFDSESETCLYVKLSDFPKFINENKTKTINYIEYHYDMGLFIRISKNSRPQKRKLWLSIGKSNKSVDSLYDMFNEMFISDYKVDLLKNFTVDCVIRTIVEHIIVKIMKIKHGERSSLFTTWVDKIIEEECMPMAQAKIFNTVDDILVCMGYAKLNLAQQI